MITALDEDGAPVRAGAGAPPGARRPYCGGPMILRHRQRSGRPDDLTYFWRHRDNSNLDCPARHVPGSKMHPSKRRGAIAEKELHR